MARDVLQGGDGGRPLADDLDQRVPRGQMVRRALQLGRELVAELKERLVGRIVHRLGRIAQGRTGESSSTRRGGRSTLAL